MSDKKLLIKLAADVEGLKAGMKQAQKSVDDFKSNVNKINGAIVGAFGAVGIQQVASFTVEIARLSGQVAGVKEAFDKIPGSTVVMNQLRAATNSTVSDLELMKAAVQASNFKIPIEQLGQLFTFAYERAKATGQSVDYLVQSIVTGIGRKSPLILDNLGISAVALKDKLKGVSSEAATIGDVAKAVGSIASEELAKMGKSAVTSAEDIAKAEAAWENFKASLGNTAAPVVSFLSKLGVKLLDAFSTSPVDKFNNAVHQLGTRGGNNPNFDFAQSLDAVKKAAADAGIDLATYNSELKGIQETLVALRSSGKIEGAGLVGPQQLGLPTPPQIAKAANDMVRMRKLLTGKIADRVENKNPFEGILNSKSSPAANIGAPNFDAMGEGLNKIIAEGKFEQLIAYWKSLDEQMQKNIATATALGESVGSNIAAALSGQQTAAQALAGISQTVIAELRKQALAYIIANAAKTGKNPVVAIALASAGFGAISALFNKIGAGGSGGGGGAGSLSRGGSVQPSDRISRSDVAQRDININAIIRGRDLVFAYDKNKQLDKSRRR